MSNEQVAPERIWVDRIRGENKEGEWFITTDTNCEGEEGWTPYRLDTAAGKKDPTAIGEPLDIPAEHYCADKDCVLNTRTAALAKQGSPPASLPPHDDSHEIDYDRYCLTCSQMGYCGMCGKPEQDVPPPADTDERAREIVGNVEFYLTEGGDLSTEAFANLSRRISAALVEKEREVWDKVTGEIERQRDKRKAQFGGLIECSQRAERLNGALDALTDLKATLQVIRKQTAARTSEKGTHEPTS